MGSLFAYCGSWDLEGVHENQDPIGKFLYVEDEPRAPTRPGLACAAASNRHVAVDAAAATNVATAAATGKATKELKSMMASQGLQLQLAKTQPLMRLYRGTLTLIHGEGSAVIQNYSANVSRVLKAVEQWLADNGTPARHWADLLSAPLEPYKGYLEQ